jgi:hypothetical protein
MPYFHLATRGHKHPPVPDFYGLIQWLYEWGGKPIYAHGVSRGGMWLEHALLERPQCLQAVFLAGSDGDLLRERTC